MVAQNFHTADAQLDERMVAAFKSSAPRAESCIYYILSRGKQLVQNAAKVAHDAFNNTKRSYFSKLSRRYISTDNVRYLYFPDYEFTNTERLLLRHNGYIDFYGPACEESCAWCIDYKSILEDYIHKSISILSQTEKNILQCYFELYYLPVFPPMEWLDKRVMAAFRELDDWDKTLEKARRFEQSGIYMNGQRVFQDNTDMGGFADVAGMDELKAQLQSDIIDVLKEPARAKALGISLPNGMLLYGPPGCGKTFFAQKLAEEAGCNFIAVNCSDIASTYIHGTQELIAEKFVEAEKNKPTIIFFDEIDAMIPKRNARGSEYTKTEVNEFLTQLNNCGKKGIIAIGATNRPQDVDEAALRSGRLEMKVYLPAPDGMTRMMILLKKLQQRSIRGILSVDEFVDKTDGWISSDVAMAVDQAARLAFRRKLEYIDADILNEVISKVRPTVSKASLKEYDEIRDKFEGRKSERPRIGFC